MKTLILVRHAKSSWDNILLSDFERTLNKRGHEDAPFMAQRLIKKHHLIPDACISSTAVRALTTAEYFVNHIKLVNNKIKLIQVPELYHANESVFVKTISGIDNQLQTIAFFSHNPGITYYANRLTKVTIDNMPTCALFIVKANCEHWEDFDNAEKTFIGFDYPKAF
ncbi:MAG: SixA phosphatase family protein [Chitinophagaceae bacterium]